MQKCTFYHGKAVQLVEKWAVDLFHYKFNICSIENHHFQ